MKTTIKQWLAIFAFYDLVVEYMKSTLLVPYIGLYEKFLLAFD